MIKMKDIKPAVIGLGYVGLPLAVEISKKYNVLGFDISQQRIKDLKKNVDATRQVSSTELSTARNLSLTSTSKDLYERNFFIVTVPTPIDSANSPNLQHLLEASNLVGNSMTKDNIVIYESTVYPGATEEICIPILEKNSGLKLNVDFFVGYSPERMNPGDKVYGVSNIIKVTSGSSKESAKLIDLFYKSNISAGTYLAPSIKVAEAAKIIENTQRDVNIALINELSMLFDKLNIDTHSVLEAANTKWNFLPFVPGLVGGHCIGVDPYYLTFKAQQVGHHPELISAGRRVNDSMPKFIAEKLLLKLIKSKTDLQKARVAIFGITFKENCPDIRNSKTCELVRILQTYGVDVDIIDPHANASELYFEYGLELKDKLQGKYEGIVLAVKHNEFEKISVSKLRLNLISNGVLFDLKNCLPKTEVDLRL